MIAFAVSLTEIEPYERYAGPGIRRVAEPDSEVWAYAAVSTIPRTMNLFLDTAAEREDLEALVLLHPHAEIIEPDFCSKIRAAQQDPEVAVVGCTGATGVRSIAWWEGSVSSAPVLHRYTERGGGEIPAYEWTHPAPPAEVDVVDGFMLVLSPWAVRNVRFDEALALGHGYEVDYCFSVREAGRKVMVADLRIIHHRALELVGEREIWGEAHIQLAEKWEGRIPGSPREEAIDWKSRARRAEAEREAARAFAHSHLLGADARVLSLERALEETTESRSWRFTEPLRWANRRRAALRRRR